MIIKTNIDYNNMIEEIKKHDYISLDTETDSLNPRKGKIIGISLSGNINKGFYIPIYEWNGAVLKETDFIKRLPLLWSVLLNKKLILHNASFDIRFIKNNFNIDLIENLYCDTILLKHCVDENPPFSLKDVSIQIQDKLGIDIEKDANFEQQELKKHIIEKGGSWTTKNKEMFKADTEIIGKYAIKDAILTLAIFYYYSKKLEELNLKNFFYIDEVMPLAKFSTIPMEIHGVTIDVPSLEQHNKEIAIDIALLEDEIQDKMIVYSYDLKTALLEKHCPISNKGKFAQAIAEKYSLNLPKTSAGKLSLTKNALEKIKDDKNKDIVAFLITGEIPRGKSAEFRKIQETLYLETTGQRHIINLNSKDQMAEVFIRGMGCKALGKTAGGKEQINDEFFESLTNNEISKLMLVYNKLIKIKSSYYERFLEEHEDGIFYPQYKAHGTTSGRYGSDFQQLPKTYDKKMLEKGLHPLIFKYSNAVRNFIIAPKDKKLIVCDMSALEVRVFTHVSQEPKLIDIFKNGEDFYSKIAINTFGLHHLSAKESDDNFLKKVAPEYRDKIKAVVLSVPYGSESFQVSRMLDISQEDAQQFIDQYLDNHPNLKQMMVDKKRLAVTKGYVQSELGRIKHLSFAKECYTKYGYDILDSLKLYKKYKDDDVMYKFMKGIRSKFKNELNVAINHCIQSLAASIMNRTAIELSKKLKHLNINIIGQVHDEFLFECKEEDAKEASNIIKDCMENTVKISVPLKTSPSIILKYGEGHD